MFFIFSVVVSVILGVIIPENMFHPPLLSPPEWLGWAIGGGTFAVLYLLKALVCSGSGDAVGGILDGLGDIAGGFD